MTWWTLTGGSGHAVSDLTGGRQQSDRSGPAAWFFRLPFRVVAAIADALLSRRGLAVLFLLIASGLTLASGLRPPLSQDLSSLHIPVALPISKSADGEIVLGGQE